jgi:adenylate kinase family enzyme
MTDRDDLGLARRLASSAMSVLRIQTSHGLYPYMLTDGSALQMTRASVSTNSMVCYTIAAVCELLPDSVASVACAQSIRSPVDEALLRDCLDRGIRALVAEVEARTSHLPDRRTRSAHPTEIFSSRSRPNAGPFDSGTFGIEDPFTLTWLLELLRFASAEPAKYPGVSEALVTTQATAIRRVGDVLENPLKPVLIPGRDEERAVRHPLPVVRIVQLARLLKFREEQKLAQVSNYFFDRLHMQLSLKGIEHGGFDPAELVFSLEGLIETAPLRATLPVLRSFLAAVDSTRQVDPTLRSLTPFKTTAYGSVHLFASVEVFESLLRIAHRQAAIGDYQFFEEIKPALHDYLQWLQATAVSGKAVIPEPTEVDAYEPETPLEYFGWQSEYAHTGDPSAHLWLTSQIILFLLGYADLLQRSVARAELARVGLIADVGLEPCQGPPEVMMAQARRDDPLQLADDSPYRVASQLEVRFVQPRIDDQAGEPSYSCLLYGPPGTGKTTLARRLASRLSWPFLTITTSDFIVDGEAQVEARAKKIFEALGTQRKMVIFFDEIDRLVLDRDTRAYERQADMLQFMTPSMLTKINDLRQLEQVIFVVGTNYADRIDRAIKRAGRIDERLLVLPPDLRRREEIIRQALETLRDERSTHEAEIHAAALAGHWRTIAEIRSAVREAVRVRRDLSEAMTSIVPAVSLENYLSRLGTYSADSGESPPAELLEEAFLLVYLLMEGKDSERLPVKYEALADRWETRASGIIRDEGVTAKLNKVFGVAD